MNTGVALPTRTPTRQYGGRSAHVSPKPWVEMTNWHNLPTRRIPLDLLVWPCHDINPAHAHGTTTDALTTGPIHVEHLLDGHYFIHDGRHRAIRAGLAGQTHIDARIHD